MPKIEKHPYQGWPNCYRITNGEVELIVTSDVGTRILRYGFVGSQNLFVEFKDQMGKQGEPDWQPRGGHRIWLGPEDVVKTYAPDNEPVQIEIRDGVLQANQPVEPSTGLRKEILVRLAEQGTAVEVLHRITNTNPMAVEWAPWALSMMAPGGVGIHPFPARGTHPEVLAPSNPLVMWAFTDLADPRWQFTNKYLILRQDPNNSRPQKLGTFNSNTVGAYLLGSELFVKRFQATGSPRGYCDMGCSFEMFTNEKILELETLGPLTRLEPGASMDHTERWTLHRGVSIAKWSDPELDGVLLSKI